VQVFPATADVLWLGHLLYTKYVICVKN